MPSRAYMKCVEIINYLVGKGYTFQVSRTELQRTIAYLIGSDPRTLRNWTETLKLLGFIEEAGLGVFKLNLVKAPSALEKVIGGERQKKLM